MTIQFDAVFQDGVFLPKQPVALPNGSLVRVAVEIPGQADDPLASIIGIADGPAAGDAAENHDEYIYGRPQA